MTANNDVIQHSVGFHLSSSKTLPHTTMGLGGTGIGADLPNQSSLITEIEMQKNKRN